MWLVEHRDLLSECAPGRALDVACGRGRNALALAELGFEVDAIDVSDVAIDAVEEHRGDLPISTLRADLAELPAFPHAPYDVIVDTMFLDRTLLPRLEAALKPGGLLVLEAFGPERRDVDARYRLEPNEIARAFPGLRTIAHREGVTVQFVGERHH